MFKSPKQILKRLFSRAEPIQVIRASQPHVLAYRMGVAQLKHNDQALVDINGVRVVKGTLEDDQTSSSTTLFFCPVDQVLVKERIKPGDGEKIDTDMKVTLVGIDAPKPAFYKRVSGVYNLKDVLICANGKITIEATPNTKWVKV